MHGLGTQLTVNHYIIQFADPNSSVFACQIKVGLAAESAEVEA